jgi:hypothetical protein
VDSDDYNKKMIKHLTLRGIYKKFSSNPIARITREVRKEIKESSLDKRNKKQLLPSSEITPRIYDLPKIHKEGILLDLS